MIKIILSLIMLASPSIADDWAILDSSGTVVRVAVDTPAILDKGYGTVIHVPIDIKVGPGWIWDGTNFTNPVSSKTISIN